MVVSVYLKAFVQHSTDNRLAAWEIVTGTWCAQLDFNMRVFRNRIREISFYKFQITGVCCDDAVQGGIGSDH
jgi:hypothetical protein